MWHTTYKMPPEGTGAEKVESTHRPPFSKKFRPTPLTYPPLVRQSAVMTNPLLDQLIAAAKKRFDAMTPEERAAYARKQRRSWVLAEAAFGSDEDELRRRVALDAGDKEALARLDEEMENRVKMATEYLDRENPE